jgi:glycosyltransferase involved in cell wall biosynthesis
MIEIMYPAHNRLAFVQATFPALLANTNWELVDRLHITDDRSRDGTYEYLADAIRAVPVPVVLSSSRFSGPVAAMNHVLDRCEAEVLGKCDSDLIVCPGWLDVMLATLDANPNIDALGMEPGFGAPVALVTLERHAKPAPFIGGVGLIRTRVFARRRPAQDKRFFGWTQFQRRHVRAAWITPDLPVFLLDHVPVEPWASLAQTYIAQGWSRKWAEYFEPSPAYYDWWVGRGAAVA